MENFSHSLPKSVIWILFNPKSKSMVLLATVDKVKISALLQQMEEWMMYWFFQIAQLKKHQENIFLIFLQQVFVANIAPFLNTLHYLKRKLNNGDLNVSNGCQVRGLCQKMHLGNTIKFWV